MQITFKKVRWKNFLSTGNTFNEIQIDAAKTTLFCGENGAGKTTFLEAISFALYGKPVRKLNKSGVVNSINKKDCLCEVEFVAGGSNWLVRRGVKPNLFEILQNGSSLKALASVRDDQEFLERILKMNHKTFMQCVIMSNRHVPFMEQPAAQRREMIEKLLDIEVFSVMNVLLKTRVDDNRDRLADADRKRASLEDKIAIHENLKRQVATNVEEEIEDLNAEKRAAEEKGVATLNQFEETLRNMRALEPSLHKEDENKRELQSVLKMIHTYDHLIAEKHDDIAFYEDKTSCPTCGQEMDDDHRARETSQARHAIQQYETLRKQEEDKHVALDEEARRIRDDKKAYQDLSTELLLHKQTITSLAAEIRSIEAKIKKALERDPNVYHGEYIEKYQLELADVDLERRELTREREALSTVSTLLKDSGIKAAIIKQYIPVINKLLKKYLADLDFYVGFEFNENFEETILGRGRDEQNYHNFSAGEKFRIDIALLFTFRAIARLRNSANTNLLILDEIMDSCLDKYGTETFLNILRSLDSDNAFVISHKTDQVLDQFDRAILFEKAGNFNRLTAI